MKRLLENSHIKKCKQKTAMHLSPSEKLNSLLKSNRLLLHSLLYDVKQDLTRLFVNLNIFYALFSKDEHFS
ncbi:hypothetical protein ACIA30_08820 [Lactobacillus delbrueckii subsp. bulgaricus]